MKRMRVLAAVALVGLCGGVAHADEGSSKSSGVAFGLSFAPTAAGVGLAIGGYEDGHGTLALVGVGLIAVGPTVGHVYSGKYDKTMMALRWAGLAAMTVGVLDAAQDGEGSSNGALDAITIIGGGACVVIGGLGELISASDVVVTPMPVPSGGGLAVAGRF